MKRCDLDHTSFHFFLVWSKEEFVMGGNVMKRKEFGMSSVFILTACFNFVVGAFLGGWMASIPSMIG